MRKISLLATILITSFVMTLSGLGASPVATASENESVRVSSRFAFGSSLLSKAQKVEIEKAVTTSGADATFLVTGVAGKLPGVSDSQVQLLAKKRAQAVKSHLVQLGVNKTSVAVKVKITRLGIVPKTKIMGSVAAPALTAPITTPITTPMTPTTPVLSCAAGGACEVGDTGPGGGIVYYVSTTNFTSTGSTCNTSCKYLEVAPATWQSAGVSVENDITYVWSNNILIFTGQDLGIPSPVESGIIGEQVNWKIGQGFNNTQIMKVTSATSTAQAKVLAYKGDATVGEWYIPSVNELNELCKYARGQTTGDPTVKCDSTGTLKTGILNDLGGFIAGVYWSSSEYSWAYASFQFLGNGNQNATLKSNTTNYVRPVRAF